MWLNSDIQTKKNSNVQFQKEINVIMYIIENKLN